jgi:hypothetical protein
MDPLRFGRAAFIAACILVPGHAWTGPVATDGSVAIADDVHIDLKAVAIVDGTLAKLSNILPLTHDADTGATEKIPNVTEATPVTGATEGTVFPFKFESLGQLRAASR